MSKVYPLYDAFVEEVDVQLQLLEDELDENRNEWKEGEREEVLDRCARIQRVAWERSQLIMEKAIGKKEGRV